MKKLLTVFIVVLLYVGIAIYFTWPLTEHITNGYISPQDKGDASSYIWDVYIFRTNVEQSLPLFHTDKVLSPIGGNLWMHGYMPAMCAFAMLFDNLYVGLNIYILLHFIFSALGAYLLSLHLHKKPLIAFIVGVAFAFSAYKMLRLTEHYTLIMTATVPFFILCFLQAFQFSYGKFLPKIISYKYLIICFVLGFLTVLNDYYSTFYLIYFSFSWAIFYALFPIWERLSLLKKTVYSIGFLVLMHLIIEPIYLSGIDDKGGIWWGGNILAFFIPNQNSWLWDQSNFARLFSSTFKSGSGLESQIFLGYCLIFLGFFSLYQLIKNKITEAIYPWVFVLCILFCLVLPRISIGTINLLYTPTAIMHFIPFLNNIRCNTRAVMMICLILPIVGSYAWLHVTQSKKSVLYTTLIPLGFLFFLMLETKPKKYSMVIENKIPAIYTDIKNHSNQTLTIMPGGVMDGLKHVGNFNNLDHYYQTYHTKKITAGYLSRVSEDVFESYLSDSIMYQIIQYSASPNAPLHPVDSTELDLFYKKFKTDMFLIKPEYRNKNAEIYIRSLLKGQTHEEIEKDGYLLIVLK